MMTPSAWITPAQIPLKSVRIANKDMSSLLMGQLASEGNPVAGTPKADVLAVSLPLFMTETPGLAILLGARNIAKPDAMNASIPLKRIFKNV